jgi:hypothetical protein
MTHLIAVASGGVKPIDDSVTSVNVSWSSDVRFLRIGLAFAFKSLIFDLID